jgi:hypothetical protein
MVWGRRLPLNELAEEGLDLRSSFIDCLWATRLHRKSYTISGGMGSEYATRKKEEEETGGEKKKKEKENRVCMYGEGKKEGRDSLPLSLSPLSLSLSPRLSHPRLNGLIVSGHFYSRQIA